MAMKYSRKEKEFKDRVEQYSGCFLKRQYCPNSGQFTGMFCQKLLVNGDATSIKMGHNQEVFVLSGYAFSPYTVQAKLMILDYYLYLHNLPVGNQQEQDFKAFLFADNGRSFIDWLKRNEKKLNSLPVAEVVFISASERNIIRSAVRFKKVFRDYKMGTSKDRYAVRLPQTVTLKTFFIRHSYEWCKHLRTTKKNAGKTSASYLPVSSNVNQSNDKA
jgi:hypothetical protein